MYLLPDVPRPPTLGCFQCRCHSPGAIPPCEVCAAWTSDINAAFAAPNEQAEQIAELEMARLFELAPNVLRYRSDLLRTDYQALAEESERLARAREAAGAVPAPEPRLYGRQGWLHRLAHARALLTSAGIDWWTPLVQALPLPWHMARHRQREWATVEDLEDLPTIPTNEATAENHLWTRRIVFEGLLDVDMGPDSSLLRITSPELVALLRALNEGSFNDIHDELFATCEIDLRVDNANIHRPVRVGFVRLLGRADPALVFLVYGGKVARLKYSRAGVLDPGTVTAWLEEGLGPLLRYAPRYLVRTRPSATETHLPGLDPCCGTVYPETPFCPRYLLPSTLSAQSLLVAGDPSPPDPMTEWAPFTPAIRGVL